MKTDDFQLSKEHEYACIIIGDEILDDHVKESNLSTIITALSIKGYALKETRIISDELVAIATTTRTLQKKYSFVVITGGIGPTHDDKTLEGIALGLEYKTILHKTMYAYCKNRPHTTDKKESAIIKMSTMPKEMEIIEHDNKWPLLKLENCFIMPGLPTICQQTVRKLAQILPQKPRRLYAYFLLNVYEHSFFEWLETLAKRFEHALAIGSYPIDTNEKERDSGALSKITISGTEEHTLKKCFQEIQEYVCNNDWLIKKKDVYTIP